MLPLLLFLMLLLLRLRLRLTHYWWPLRLRLRLTHYWWPLTGLVAASATLNPYWLYAGRKNIEHRPLAL